MSQNDYVIANQTTPLFRADLNLALQALASNSSGSSAPSTTYANMMWYDTTTNILKMRSEADDAWISIGTLDQSLNTFTPAGLTNLSQAQVEDDTSTVFGQVSGERLAQASAINVPNILNAGGSAPIYACRAWVNFNGTGTVAIRASGNVSSITDNGTGDYTVNFATPMEDANYAAVGGISSFEAYADDVRLALGGQTVSSIRIITAASSIFANSSYVQLAIVR